MTTRFHTIFGLLLIGSCTTASAAARFNPANADLVSLNAALDSGRLTSERLVEHYLARIARFDQQGIHINALITLNPQALAQARQSDRERSTVVHRSPLYGIPFIAKDNYDTAGLATSGGSVALLHSLPRANAVVVQRLLDRGAILLGKANMSELAASYGRLGYSSAGGLTLNPYNTARDVSGSSSGSAAAVAADFAAFALGTDTAGSVRAPASVAGLVGLRPTLGLTSRTGVIPLSLTFDTTGVLAHTVSDVAVVLDAIAAADPLDVATLRQPAAHGSYVEAARDRSVGGIRLGWVGNFRGGNAEVDDIETASIARLRSMGILVVPLRLPEQFDTLWTAVLDPVGRAEFKPQMERYLKTLAPGQPRTLAQLIEISSAAAATVSAPSSEHPINPARLAALRDADTTTLTDSPKYIDLLTHTIPSLRDQLSTLMAKNDVSMLVFATMSCPASPRFDRPDPSYLCNSEDVYKAAYVAAAAGFPEISVPAGRAAANMPVGMSFMAMPYAEQQLMRVAAAFQAAGPRLSAPPLH